MRGQDKANVIFFIGMLLKRLSLLYQVPNFTEDHQEVLSEWVYDTYQCDELEIVKKCLTNPPPTDKQNWRLTPDTIQTWMSVYLEKSAEQRENEHNAAKAKDQKLATAEGKNWTDRYRKFYGDNFFGFAGNVLNQDPESKEQKNYNFSKQYAEQKVKEEKVLTEKDKEFNDKNKL